MAGTLDLDAFAGACPLAAAWRPGVACPLAADGGVARLRPACQKQPACQPAAGGVAGLRPAAAREAARPGGGASVPVAAPPAVQVSGSVAGAVDLAGWRRAVAGLLPLDVDACSVGLTWCSFRISGERCEQSDLPQLLLGHACYTDVRRV